VVPEVFAGPPNHHDDKVDSDQYRAVPEVFADGELGAPGHVAVMAHQHLMFRIQGSGLRVEGSGLRIQGSRFRFPGSGFRVQDCEFRVQGSGFRGKGVGFKGQHHARH